MKIYSKVKPEILLHFINRFDEIINERHNLVSDENFIQCAAMKLPKGKTFEPHKHFKREILEEDTIVYEYKTGPYSGQKMDKIFINKV